MDGIHALDHWDILIEVFHSSPNQTNKTKDVREPRGNLSATLPSNMQEREDPCTNLREVRAAPHKLQTRKKSHGMIEDLDDV